MKHVMTRECGGQNEMSWAKSICSCGWEGRKHYSYENYQLTLLSKQEGDHMAKVMRETYK